MHSHPRGMRLELKPSKTKRICLIGSDNLGKLHYILSNTKKKTFFSSLWRRHRKEDILEEAEGDWIRSQVSKSALERRKGLL